MAATAGFSDPRPFSIRTLERAARTRRREEWDKIAVLRFDLRRLLGKGKDEIMVCDFNPVYSKEERAKIKESVRKAKKENLPKATAQELFAALSGK